MCICVLSKIYPKSVVLGGLCVALGLCLVNMEYELIYGHWGPLALVCVISSLLLIIVLSMALQPSSRRELAFKVCYCMLLSPVHCELVLINNLLQVPLVPVIPAVSILLNTYLILMLDLYTWIRFMIWMAVGKFLYLISDIDNLMVALGMVSAEFSAFLACCLLGLFHLFAFLIYTDFFFCVPAWFALLSSHQHTLIISLFSF